MGAYHGKYGFEAFSHKKAIMKRPHGMEFLNSLRYTPITDFSLTAFKTLAVKGIPAKGIMNAILKKMSLWGVLNLVAIIYAFYLGTQHGKK